MSEWNEATIDQIKADSSNAIAMGPFGSRIKTDNFVSVGVPVIRGNNLNAERLFDDNFVYLTEEKADELRSSNAFPGDIVITHRGTLGQVGIIPSTAKYPRYVVSQSQMKLTVNKQKADPSFIFYFLRSPQGQYALLSNTSQTGVPAIAQPTTSLKAITIHLPPLPEQRAIAHILGTMDDKIELNRRMNETLEAMARAIFKSWFVDFAPVRAKAEGRDTGLPEEIADLFPDSFEETELGEVPKGWKITRLQDVLSIDKGLSYKGQFLSDNGKPMVNLGCFLGNGKFTAEAIKGYSGEFKTRHTIRPEDLVIANTDITQKREVIGSPGLVPPQAKGEEFLFSHHVFAARFHEGAETLKLFVLFSLLREEFRERATGYATGTTVLALPRDSILDYQFARPTGKLIEIFNHKSWPLIYRQWNGIEESRTIAKMRDTLLPKLISGELRVKEAEKLVGC